MVIIHKTDIPNIYQHSQLESKQGIFAEANNIQQTPSGEIFLNNYPNYDTKGRTSNCKKCGKVFLNLKKVNIHSYIHNEN